MFFKDLCALVLWTKVASALEVLINDSKTEVHCIVLLSTGSNENEWPGKTGKASLLSSHRHRPTPQYSIGV